MRKSSPRYSCLSFDSEKKSLLTKMIFPFEYLKYSYFCMLNKEPPAFVNLQIFPVFLEHIGTPLASFFTIHNRYGCETNTVVSCSLLVIGEQGSNSG